MSDMAGGRGRGPLEDAEMEALLTGGGTDREELASLDRFLEDIRATTARFDPQPSGELARLFADGPSGLMGVTPDVGSDAVVVPVAQRRSVSAGRKPVRRLAKVAVATTTAALAVTLAAAAQVLPGSQPRTPLSTSGPATPVRVGADQSVTLRTPDVAAVPGITMPRPSSTSAVARPGATVRSAAEADLDAMSSDALARLPLDVLRTLSPGNLARLPVEVLRTLPGEVLARVPAEVLRTLPADVLAKLPVDALRTLPGEALARLSADVLRTLPVETLLRLPADAVRTLPGDLLARLPLDVLQALPADVQRRLPVDILRLVLGGPSPSVTTSTTAPVRP